MWFPYSHQIEPDSEVWSLRCRLLGKWLAFLSISVLINETKIFIFSSHISTALCLGSFRIMDNKLLFVQKSPFNECMIVLLLLLGKIISWSTFQYGGSLRARDVGSVSVLKEFGEKDAARGGHALRPCARGKASTLQAGCVRVRSA